MEKYKRKLINDAEIIVLQDFPKWVIEINQLLEVRLSPTVVSHRVDLSVQSGQFSYDRLPELLPDTDLNIPRPEHMLINHAQASLLHRVTWPALVEAGRHRQQANANARRGRRGHDDELQCVAPPFP